YTPINLTGLSLLSILLTFYLVIYGFFHTTLFCSSYILNTFSSDITSTIGFMAILIGYMPSLLKYIINICSALLACLPLTLYILFKPFVKSTSALNTVLLLLNGITIL